MIRELSETEIWELVDRAQYGHLGCHADGKTYVVPISFARDGDRLIGLTSPGQKIDMMRKNPDVCVQMEEIESLTHWRSVILHGRYEELMGAERARAVGLLIDRYGESFAGDEAEARRGREVTPPRLDQQPQPAIVYAIHISDRSGRTETR